MLRVHNGIILIGINSPFCKAYYSRMDINVDIFKLCVIIVQLFSHMHHDLVYGIYTSTYFFNYL